MLITPRLKFYYFCIELLENDIDGIALKEILNEANGSSLKELIPKVGPRLRTLSVLQEEYDIKGTKGTKCKQT